MATAEQIMRADAEGRRALCATCDKVVNVTTRGRLFAHGAPPVRTGPNTYLYARCVGSGSPAATEGSDPLGLAG